MGVQLIITRVQVIAKDMGAKWLTPDAICANLAICNDDLETELQTLGLNFDTQEVILPKVPANTTNLNGYQVQGQVLFPLVLCKTIEWRLVGQNQEQWETVEQVQKVVDTSTGTGETPTGGSVTGFAINFAGFGGYQEGDIVSVLQPPNGSGCNLIVHVLAGVPTGLTESVGSGGIGYSLGNNLATQGGHGTGLTVDILNVTPQTSVASDDPTVESWEWRGGNIYLSPCSQPVDLRVRFQGLPTLLNADSPFEPFRGLVNILAYWVAQFMEESRNAGVTKLSQLFEKRLIKAKANFRLAQTQGQQGQTLRLAGRRSTIPGGFPGGTGGFTPPIVG
jgi:hypothetical protein